MHTYSTMRYDAAIIGGGPAGLLAAQRAAERGRRTILLEKNREVGVKILISGGTRCNLTHATNARGIVAAFGPNGRFLHSALAALGPDELVDLFAAEGVPTKIEEGGKVFPISDRAADVRDALARRLQQSGCELALGEPLVELQRGGNVFQLTTPRRTIEAANVLLATGGKSYPSCGTTGDGYAWAAALGHTIVEPRPALVPVTSHASWVAELQGIALPDVEVMVIEPADDGAGGKEKCLARRRGSMLFAHFGLSGPAVLDVSRAVSGHANPNKLVLRCDLLPDVKEAALQTMLDEIIAASTRQRAAGLLDVWLPHRVGLAVLGQAGIAVETPLAELSKPLRRRAARTVKRLEISIAGTMGFRKAEVTAGGVALDEVDQRTMQSRLVPGLFFAGELLDLDGPVGGYNFQAAFSTGRLAGENL